MFHAEGRTDIQNDMMSLTVAFRNFANAPKEMNWKNAKVAIKAVPPV